MARQSGIIQYRGRLGETVGMKNGFDGNENLTRSYVAKPKNPQSTLQVDGRAKMLPAVLFNRQLTEVISRAWEGVKYGGPSTRKFMQYAMREPWSNIPQIVKDSVLPVPGKYLVSRGSLPTLAYQLGSSNNVNTGLKCDSTLTTSSTVGQWSESLLSKNSYLREGDQLTFIFVYTDSQITFFNYRIASIYLDTTSTETPGEAAGIIAQVGMSGADRIMSVEMSNSGTLCAAAVILSRDGSTQPQRSTQRMLVNETLLASYFASTLKASVAASYQTKSTGRSVQDWPYEGGDVPTTDTRLRILVSASPEAGGTVTGGGRYEEGAQVTLRATPAAGYTFDGWHSGGETLSVNATYTFTAVTNMTIVGEFMEGEQP